MHNFVFIFVNLTHEVGKDRNSVSLSSHSAIFLFRFSVLFSPHHFAPYLFYISLLYPNLQNNPFVKYQGWRKYSYLLTHKTYIKLMFSMIFKISNVCFLSRISPLSAPFPRCNSLLREKF